MNKIRVLVVSEGSFLNTGYGKYALELLTYLNSRSEYEVAELAAYGTFEEGHPMYVSAIKTIPWKIYPNIPLSGDSKGNEIYNSHPVNEFGKFRFELACLEFKPDIVLSFRDYWMDSYIDDSPFRDIFRWIHMPTVDAEPQQAEWLDTYSRADVLLTYSDWAIDSLKKQNFKKEVFGSAPPAGTIEIEGIDKRAERKKLGIADDTFVVGTVMRNQPRKLYDILFKSFAEFAETADNAILYCHTGYPDVGWKLPELLVTYNIADKVVFTYTCQSCGVHYCSKYNQALSFCPGCGKQSAILANTKNGVSHEDMSRIMSTFDVYCQIANSEGFGLPQVEAAAVGVPVIATDYSAMSDVVRKLHGVPIDCTLITEVESNCLRAIPNHETLTSILISCYNMWDDKDSPEWSDWSKLTYDSYKQCYDWEKSCKVWEEAIKKVYRPANWNRQPKFCDIPDVDNLPHFTDAVEFVKFCYGTVLGRPELIYSYEGQRTLTDLNSGFKQIDKRKTQKVSPKDVLNNIIMRANYNNMWESKRAKG